MDETNWMIEPQLFGSPAFWLSRMLPELSIRNARSIGQYASGAVCVTTGVVVAACGIPRQVLRMFMMAKDDTAKDDESSASLFVVNSQQTWFGSVFGTMLVFA
jgi:hypothetical protein